MINADTATNCGRCGRLITECGGKALCFRNRNTKRQLLCPSTKTPEARKLGYEFSQSLNKSNSEKYSRKNTNDNAEVEKQLIQQHLGNTNLANQVVLNARSNPYANIHEDYQHYGGIHLLDSGSSGHFSPYVTDLDTTCQVIVTGFNGSSERTNGKGNIKCICQDAYTSQPFECQLTEAHSYNGSKSLISLGLLLREGWKFTADLESCFFL